MVSTAKPSLEVLPGGGQSPREALRELYSKYGGSVCGRCRYLLEDLNLAEDAMQEVFAKALANLSEFRGQASPLTWLMRIATHHCLNIQRGQRARWWQVFREKERHKPESVGGPQAMEMRDMVRRMLQHFDTETAAAAIHYHVDQMTLEEIAALLERSIPTIRRRLEHFKRESRQRWNP